jgi:ABC-2 type transport system permease protein
MSVFGAIAGVTLRALLGRRRSVLMLLLGATPVLLGLLVVANAEELSPVTLGATIDGFVNRVVLPLIALVFGTSALGSELDDGTAIPLLTKPIARRSIILAKIAVAGTLTAALVVPSTLVAGLLMGGGGGDAIRVTFAYSIANLLGSYLYVAIFLVLGVITSRGLIIGLAYSLIWEAVVSSLLRGSQVFSVREYVAGIASALEPAASPDSVIGAGGFLYAAVVFAAAAAIGSLALSTYEVRGTD